MAGEETARAKPDWHWKALALALVVGGGVSIAYWLHARRFESTDDAFIDASVAVVPLVIMTHQTTEGATRRAKDEIDRLRVVRPGSIRMKVRE